MHAEVAANKPQEISTEHMPRRGRIAQGLLGMRPVSVAEWLLRAGVFLYCLAIFAKVFSTRQTRFGNLLFLEWELPYSMAVVVEKFTVSLFLLAGLIVLLRPWWPVLLFVISYAILEPIAGTLQGGYHFSDWSLPGQALRWGFPVVLLLLVAAPRSQWVAPWRLPLVTGGLRLLIAAVFFSHGYYCLMEHPGFIDLVIGSGKHLISVRVSETTALFILTIIGVVDICVALALLVYPVPLGIPRRLWADPCRICPIRRVIMPTLLGWMAFWGLVTALARVTALGIPVGLQQYTEVLMRAPHFLGPLALLLLLRYAPREACRPPQRRKVKSVRLQSELPNTVS